MILDELAAYAKERVEAAKRNLRADSRGTGIAKRSVCF